MLSKIHIAVEGAIAVGKTTLLPKLHSVIASHNNDIDLVLEPVDKWVKWEGKNENWNLLDMMFKDPKTYAAAFQMAAAISKIQSLQDAPKPCRLVERTLLCQEKVFIPLLVKNDFLTELDQSLLAHFFTMAKKYDGVVADVIVYLRTSPEIALTRIWKCNRQGEEDLSLDYLTDLHLYYDYWLLNEKNVVVVVDADSFDAVIPEEIFKQILDILKLGGYMSLDLLTQLGFSKQL